MFDPVLEMKDGQAVMPDGSFKELSLSDYRGKYVVLFFYPQPWFRLASLAIE